MNAIHPLMAAALAPFAPPLSGPRFPVTYCSQCGGEFGPGDQGYSSCSDHQRTASEVASAARLYQAPPCPKGCFTYYFDKALMDCTLVCHLEYEPAERGSREHGFQMEPDYPAQATLVAAYVRDVNVYDLLDNDRILQIEVDALLSLEGEES